MRNRKSTRMADYDYSQPGYYFVTICTQNREYLFGDIVNGNLILHDSGKMVSEIWAEIPVYYPGIEIDEYVVMPNHLHGIIKIQNPIGSTHVNHPAGTDPRVCPKIIYETNSGQSRGIVPADTKTSLGLSVSMVIQRFKSLTTKKHIDGVNCCGWMPFKRQLWQRSFHDRIIRNDDELNRIRKYIIENPLKWAEDEHAG